MKPLLWINDDIFLLFLFFWTQCEGSVPTVTAVLHGTAVLPCSVPFISGTEDLYVSWVKMNGTKPSLVLHTFLEGQFNLTYQAPQYRGRTNMTPDLSNGRLDLTLTHVEHRDEGVYVCQVTNTADHRDIEVRLTVIGSVPTVTAVLHGTAVLPCSVPFISGTEDLLVSWVKKIGTKPSLVLHTFNKGQFDLTYQAPRYRGRTNMSDDLSNGRLDLTLTHVEHRDEGVYVCQVTNTKAYRDIEVTLSVFGSVPTVTAVLHGTAVLPCSVPFISGTQDLLVSWVKKIGTKPSLVLHTFIEGQFNLTYQAPQYRGRTNMTPDFSNGRLDLTLTHVEHRDEGVYVCQVTNTADHRDIEVRLTVIEKKHRNEHDIVIGQNFLGRDVEGYIEERSAGSGRVCPGLGPVLTIALLVFLELPVLML